ncbi:type IV toxin-antitoxin system AbiEi family antitoxin [Microbacterium sp. R86528]|uniref:type IV toxin-antitoxin system AbiEi family antitoxin n=1 Tax=Microbacterium sp. R86528 TaxID=3093864 RepID=UPI0037C7B096
MASPFLYFPDDRLSLAELTAACLDGDLVELGPAFMPADAVETSALRAGSMQLLLGGSLAATHLSAAWIYGTRHNPPLRHNVQRAVPQRRNRLPARSVIYRDVQLPGPDLQRIGGVWVTSPARTVGDLARTHDEEYRATARQMVAYDLPLLRASIRQLEASTLPHKHEALALLCQQDVAG